jgi:hypothetical protein
LVGVGGLGVKMYSLTVLTEFVVNRYKLTDIPFSRLDLAFIERFDF